MVYVPKTYRSRGGFLKRRAGLPSLPTATYTNYKRRLFFSIQRRPSVRPLGLFSGLFFNTLCRIDLKLGTCIYLVLLQIKFAFRINRVTVTYFMAETRSNLCFAFPA